MSEEIKALKDELELYKMMHRHLSVENKKILKMLDESKLYRLNEQLTNKLYKVVNERDIAKIELMQLKRLIKGVGTMYELTDEKGNVLYKAFYQKKEQVYTVLDQNNLTNIKDMKLAEFMKFKETNNLYTLNELGVK